LLIAISRLSRETDQLSKIQEKEKAKIEAYNNTSFNLKAISAVADKEITPRLAESLATVEDCGRLIKENNEACEKIWKNAVEAFVEEVTSSVAGYLQNALLSIKTEAELQPDTSNYKAARESAERHQKGEYKAERMYTSRSLCHQDKDDAAGDLSGIERGYKRRRLSPSSLFWQDPSDINSDEDFIMKAMKMPFKEQGLALADLGTENNEASGIKTNGERWKLTHESQLRAITRKQPGRIAGT